MSPVILSHECSLVVDVHNRWMTISFSTVAMRLLILPALIVQLQKTAKIGVVFQKCKLRCLLCKLQTAIRCL